MRRLTYFKSCDGREKPDAVLKEEASYCIVLVFNRHLSAAEIETLLIEAK